MIVNQQIKATLTELLNCEGVKQDRRYCDWVQEVDGCGEGAERGETA